MAVLASPLARTGSGGSAGGAGTEDVLLLLHALVVVFRRLGSPNCEVDTTP